MSGIYMHESKTDGPNFFKHGAKHFKNVLSFRLWFYAGVSLVKVIDTKYYVNTVKLGFKELFGHHKKVPYRVYLMKNQGKLAIFLESILLLTKNISLMDLVLIT